MLQNWISDNFTWIFQTWKTRGEMWRQERWSKDLHSSSANATATFFSLFSSFNFEPIKRHFPPLLTYFFPRSRKYLGAQLLNRVGVRRSRVSRWTNPLNFHAKCKYAIEREERSYVHISGDRLMEVAEEVLDYSGKNWFMNKFIYPKFRNKYGDRVIFETECGYNIND